MPGGVWIEQTKVQPRRSAAVLFLAATSFVHQGIVVPQATLTLAANAPTINGGAPVVAFSGATHFIDRTVVQPRRSAAAMSLATVIGQSPNTIAIPTNALQLNAFPPLFITQATPIFGGQDLQTDKDFSEYWQPERRNFLALYQFAGSNAINVNTGLLTLAGLNPSILIGGPIFPPTGILTLAALTPSVIVQQNVNLTIPIASLGLSGLNPLFVGSQTYLIPQAQLALTGLAPQVGQIVLITMPNFIGQFVADALNLATADQLNVSIIQIGYPSTQDVIVDQVPPPNVLTLNTSPVLLYRGLPYFLGTGNRHEENIVTVIGANDLNSDNGGDENA